jgi:hypothetical protein
MNGIRTWPDLRAVVIVHLACLAMAGYAGWFVVKYGSAGVPICDEWHLLAEWTTENDTLRWAGKHHFEHRYPLGKLAWISTLQATGWNFRAPMLLTVGLLTASSILLVWTARIRRGQTRYSDSVIPVLLLHLGHQFNLTMSYQVGFALFVYAVAGWKWCAAKFDASGRNRWLWLAGVYGAMGLSCGGFGLVFTVPWVLWCAWMGWNHRRWMWAFAVLATAYTAWVVLTMPANPAAVQPSREPLALLQGTWAYASTALGDWHVAYPIQTKSVEVLTLGLYLLVLVSLRKWNSSTVALVLGSVVLVLGLGFATTWVRGVGYGSRFVSISAVCFASMWVLITTCRTWPKWIDLLALTFAGALLWVNHNPAIRSGYQLRKACEEFRIDCDNGLSAEVLQGKYQGTMMVVVGGLADDIRMLKTNNDLKLHRVSQLPQFTVQPVAGVVTPFDYECPADRVPDPPGLTFPEPPPGTIALRLTVTTTQAPGWQRVVFSDENWTYETFTPWVPTPGLHLIVPVPAGSKAITMKPLTHIAGFRVEAAEWLVK